MEAMLYLYHFHLYGEIDVFTEPFDDESLFCEDCGDSDELLATLDPSAFLGGDMIYVYEDCNGEYCLDNRLRTEEELYCDSCDSYVYLVAKIETSKLK